MLPFLADRPLTKFDSFFFFFQHHDKNSEEKKRIYKELKKIIRDREDENMELDNDLEDLNVSVNERKHIQEVNGKIYQDFINIISTHSSKTGPFCSWQ